MRSLRPQISILLLLTLVAFAVGVPQIQKKKLAAAESGKNASEVPANGTVPATGKTSFRLSSVLQNTTVNPAKTDQKDDVNVSGSKTVTKIATPENSTATAKPKTRASLKKTSTTKLKPATVKKDQPKNGLNKTTSSQTQIPVKNPNIRVNRSIKQNENEGKILDHSASGGQQFAVVVEHDLETAAGGYGKSHHSSHKGGFHKSDGHKSGKGFHDKHGFKKGHKGDFGKKGDKGHFDKGGKHYKGDHHKSGKHGHHKSGKHGGKGHKSGEKGFHDKGFSKKGFKHEHHKQEDGLSKKFWDHADHKGFHKDYEHFDSHFKKHKGGGFAGKSFKSNKHHDKHGKKGFFDKGDHHNDKKGHHGKFGKHSDHSHKSDYGKKGGHKSGHKSYH